MKNGCGCNTSGTGAELPKLTSQTNENAIIQPKLNDQSFLLTLNKTHSPIYYIYFYYCSFLYSSFISQVHFLSKSNKNNTEVA